MSEWMLNKIRRDIFDSIEDANNLSQEHRIWLLRTLENITTTLYIREYLGRVTFKDEQSETNQYEYENSIEDPENFWSEIAKTFQWQKTWDNTFSWNFNGPDVKWFENAKLNITENIFDNFIK